MPLQTAQTAPPLPSPGVIEFSFSAYANPERPGAGYVGPWQLGPVSISGGGAIRESDGALISGGIIQHADNLRDSRYPMHRTTWQVVRGAVVQRTATLTVLRLQVRVVASNYPFICPVGTLGVVTLIDDKSIMPNRQTRDGVGTEMPNPASRAPDGGLACRTHTHGMNNTDLASTEPPRGGPSGGMWAKVRIISGPNLAILGTWMRISDHHVVQFTLAGNAIVGHVLAVGDRLGSMGFRPGEATFRVLPAGGDFYTGQVEWRNTNGQVWWQATRQQVVGNQMHGEIGDWVRVTAQAPAIQAVGGHQSGGIIVDPPQ